MLFIEYPKCSTCQRAGKWLEEHGAVFERRHIVEKNPTKEELKQLIDPASYTGLCSVLAVEMADKAEKAAAIIKEEHKNQDSWEELK